MINPAQILVDALTLGSMYALVAMGVSLVFGILRLINFAHGDLIMIGAYAAITVLVPTWWAILAATVAAIIAAILMERFAFRPVRSADLTTLLVTSFAVSFGLQSAAVAVFGSLQRGGSVAPELNTTLDLGVIRVPLLNPVIVGVTVLLTLGLSLFLSKTSVGVQMRAAAEDFPTARMLGVSANRVIAIAFGISGLFAGVAAFFYVVQLGYVTPSIGNAPVLAAFVAVVIGGVGSLRGAIVGGYILGLVTTVLQSTLPQDWRGFTTAIAYAVVLAFLVLKPDGLLPTKLGLAERA